MQVKNKTKARLLLLLTLFCALCASLSRVYAAALPEGGGSGEESKASLDGEEFWHLVQEKPLLLLEISGEAGERKKRVLVMGATGAGKSTTINYLLGRTMGGVRVGLETRVCVEEAGGAGGPEIGHRGVSCTTLCGAYDGRDFSYIDTPGFGDTRGSEQEVYNRLAVYSFIEQVGGVDTVLIVVGYPEIQSRRGQQFIELLGELSLMMHNLDDAFMPNIFWGVTRLSVAGLTSEELVSGLKEILDGGLTTGDGELKQGRDGRTFDAGKIMTDIFERGHLFPIYPLDEGASREVLLGAIRSNDVDPIPAKDFKLGVTGMDIEGLLLPIFKKYSTVGSLGEFLRGLGRLKEDTSLLLSRAQELEGIAKGSEEASEKYRKCLEDLRIQKEGEIAGVDKRIRDLGDLEEVVRYITINSNPRSNGGYFWSTTMTATYGGIPFSREDSRIIDAKCTYDEVTCEPAEGRWEVRFTTLQPRAGKILDGAVAEGKKVGERVGEVGGVGVVVVGVGAVGVAVGGAVEGAAVAAAAGEGAAVALGVAAGEGTVVGLGVAAGAGGGVIKGAERVLAEAQKVGAEAGRGIGKTLGAALGGVGAGVCALVSGKQEYSPKLEVWCKRRDIHADRLTAFEQQKQDMASRIEELRRKEQEAFEHQAKEAGERREKAEAEAKGLLAKVEESYENLRGTIAHIATHYNVLAFVEKVVPLMDQSRVKAHATIEDFMANYQKYKELQEQEGGIFAQVDITLQEVVALETSLSASLGVADFLERAREPGRAFASLRLDGESIVSEEDDEKKSEGEEIAGEGATSSAV